MPSRWILLGICLAAFGLRVWRLDYHAYRGDESFVIWFVAQDWPSLIAATARNEPHPPLFYVLMKLWRDGVGDSETIFRFLPAFFGTLSIPLVGRLGWRIVPGRATGLIAALLLAISPFHIWYSQDARMYTQAVALVLASTIAYVHWAADPTDRRRAAGYVAVSLLAAFTHYAFVPVLAVQNLLWVVRHRSRPALVAWFVVQAVIGVLLAGWLIANRGLLGGYVGNGDSPSFVTALFRAAVSYVTGRTGSAEWANLAGLLALILAAVGSIALIRRAGRWAAALTVLVVLTGVTAQWVASLRGPVYSETYVLPVSGPFYLLIAAAAVAFGRLARPLVILPVVAIALIAAASLANYWFVPSFAKGADWRSEAQAIARDARPGDVVVVNYPDPTFEYYFRAPLPVTLLPKTVPFDPAAVRDELASIAASANRIWLVPVRAANWDKDGFVEAWLNDRADPIASAAFHQVRLVLYETPRGALAEARSIDAELGPAITLRAASVPATCERRCETTVRLVWSASTRPAADYSVFVHVLDSTGSLVAQHDGVPADGRRPTSGWAAGDLVVDSHDIAAALPAGTYRVIAGMYGADGRRLPTAGGDTVTVGDLIVR